MLNAGAAGGRVTGGWEDKGFVGRRRGGRRTFAISFPMTRVTRLPYVARPMTSDAAESTKIQYSAVTELGNDTSLGWL